MRIYPWLDKYNIDLEAIDREHKTLLVCINKLIAAQKMDRQFVLKLADEVMFFSQHHMLSEENLMYLTGYSGLTDHAAQHKQILTALQAERRKLDESMEHFQAFVSVLVNWFIHHTQTTDRKMAAHIARFTPEKRTSEAVIKSVVTRSSSNPEPVDADSAPVASGTD